MADQGAQAGIATAIIGNIVLNTAINIRRHARQRIVHMAVHGITVPSKHDQLWFFGLFLAISGELVNFLAYGLAPASVVGPLGVFVVISNCVIPALLFDESPHIHVVAGTMIALPGLLLCIISGPEQPCSKIEFPDWSPGGVGYTYAKCTLGLVMILALIREAMRECGWACMTANTSLAALMGTFGILGLKTFSLSLIRGEEPAEGNASYLAVFVVCTAAQLSLLGDSLKRFAVWQVVPLHFAFFTSFVSISSGLIFYEFEGTTLFQRAEFAAGLVLVTTGAWLSSKPHDHQINAARDPPKSVSQSVSNKDKPRLKRKSHRRKNHKRLGGIRYQPSIRSSTEISSASKIPSIKSLPRLDASLLDAELGSSPQSHIVKDATPPATPEPRGGEPMSDPQYTYDEIVSLASVHEGQE